MIKKIISSKVFKWTLVGLYAGLIFSASSMKIHAISPKFSFQDKVIHFILYGIFCTLLCWAISAHLNLDKTRNVIFLAIIVASLYGITDEVHQLFVPRRSGEILDWIADAAGATTAGICWLKFYPAWKRRVKS